MRVLRLVVLMCVLFVLSGRASAALILVHDNGGPDLPNGFVSDPTFPLQVGDDFQLFRPFGITRVTWYGAYAGGDELPNGPDHFAIRFFPFGGSSSPSQFPIVDLAIGTVTRSITTLTTAGGNPVFSYQADFSSVDLLSGRYLLSIVNDTTAQPEQWVWHLHSSTSGDAFWQRFNNGTNWLGPFGSEMSLQIYAVPEVGTGAMMGVAGLVVLRRRGRR